MVNPAPENQRNLFLDDHPARHLNSPDSLYEPLKIIILHTMKPKLKNKKPTQSSVAASLGVSRQLLAAYVKKPDAPALDDLTGWTIYLAQKGRIGSVPPDLRRAIAQERLAILRETKKKLARENEVQAGRMMPTADAQRQAAQAMTLTFAELERRDRELPPAMAGLSAERDRRENERRHGVNTEKLNQEV